MSEKNTNPRFIIPNFFLSIFFLLLLLLVSFFVWQNIKDINEEKEEVKNIQNEINELKQNWLSYNALIDKWMQEKNMTFYYERLTNKSYDKYLNNSWWVSDYETFLKNKKIYIDELTTNEDFLKRKKSFVNILPTYVSVWYTEWLISDNEKWTDKNWNIDFVNWLFSDLLYATYIESILNTFDLSTESKSIDLKLKDVNDMYWFTNDSLDDTKIYYFTYNFDVTWSRSNIIDFLYFLDNVWTINTEYVEQEDSDIFLSAKEWNEWEVNFITNDDDYSRYDYYSSFIDSDKKDLIWYIWGNIFEKQLIDIESISLDNDFSLWLGNIKDDVLKKESYDEIWKMIKKQNQNEEIQVKISARFYVKNVPDYKVNSAYNDLKNKVETIKKELDNIEVTNENSQDILKMRKYYNEVDQKVKELESYVTNKDYDRTSVSFCIRARISCAILRTPCRSAGRKSGIRCPVTCSMKNATSAVQSSFSSYTFVSART